MQRIWELWTGIFQAWCLSIMLHIHTYSSYRMEFQYFLITVGRITSWFSYRNIYSRCQSTKTWDSLTNQSSNYINIVIFRICSRWWGSYIWIDSDILTLSIWCCVIIRMVWLLIWGVEEGRYKYTKTLFEWGFNQTNA